MDRLATAVNKQFGSGAAQKGSVRYRLNAISTGSLAFDYALGTGGWPRGHMVGVFGPRDIGKSSIVGLNAIREAQALKLNAVIIAVEPGFDADWAEKHGVDTERLLVLRPDNGEDAFRMLHKCATSGVIDLVIFDSIGALLSPSEVEDDGKMKAGGQAGLITWGVKRCVKPIYDNNVACIMLNQVREDMNSRMAGVLKQPGGKAIEHSEAIICQLKRGPNRFLTKVDGEEVEYGHEVVALIKRNKLAQGTGKKAVFNFYGMELSGLSLGIDRVADAINTGKRLGVIATRGAWLDLPDGTSHNGSKAAGEHIQEHAAALQLIRDGVMHAMLTNVTEPVEGEEVTDA
jgi:recombination protein RecA